jgi:hypothetical protein
MTTRTRSPLRDPELLEMLADKPELLAIADALVETSEPPTKMRRLPLAQGRVVAASTGACLVAAAAVLLLLFSPWEGNGSLIDKALAAVGSRDVLHVVVEQPVPDSQTLVDIATGKPIPSDHRTEIWFDAGRDMKKTVTSLDGKVLDEMLETRDGGWAQGGPVYTCAWIAAHPVEATKARVSCNENMKNGTTPRTIPEKPPTLDEVLAGFVDRYQSALASGKAERLGTGTLNGREVIWLRITTPSGQPPAGEAPLPPTSQDVAIDSDSYKPVLVRQTDGGVSVRVLTAETISYDPSLFTKPQPVETQGGGNVSPGTTITTEQAASILGRDLLWLGREWHDWRLVETTHHTPTFSLRLASERRREHAAVIGLTYAPLAHDGTADPESEFTIYEANRCVVNVGMMCAPRGPGEGQMLVMQPFPTSLRLNGLYLSIWPVPTATRQPDALDIAQALHPFQG